MSAQSHAELVDVLIELYCDWRTKCTEVRAAYARFTDAAAQDRAIAYALYGAALDREESAANEYARQLMRVARIVPEASDRVELVPSRSDLTA